MREALRDGQVGVDGVVGVVGAFRGCLAGRVELLAADEELAAAACGEGADAAPPASADELRAFAQVWAAYLDQDGAEPAESRALRKRGFTVGRRGHDGLVPVRGNLMPEVAAQLQLGFDSVLNPRVDDVPGPCFIESAPMIVTNRSRAPQMSARMRRSSTTRSRCCSRLPRRPGLCRRSAERRPPWSCRCVRKTSPTAAGFAHLPGDDEPISIAAARRIACTGAVQRVVTGANGRVVSIETLDRVFNHHQRRAITLRDGGCLIPGCHVPPQWCEIHHVEEHSRGGPTHTDNGVLLCWFHHRTIDSGSWSIRMVDGVPHVRGPHWWDAREVATRDEVPDADARRDRAADMMRATPASRLGDAALIAPRSTPPRR